MNWQYFEDLGVRAMGVANAFVLVDYGYCLSCGCNRRSHYGICPIGCGFLEPESFLLEMRNERT